MKKTELKLRISGFKDYIAVDEMNDNIIEKTLLYLPVNKTATIYYFDAEEKRWYETTIKINDKFTAIKCTDTNGFEWESPFSELTDISVVQFQKKF